MAVSTYPNWNCSEWFTFATNMKILHSNGIHNCHDAYTNNEQEICTYNMHHRHESISYLYIYNITCIPLFLLIFVKKVL